MKFTAFLSAFHNQIAKGEHDSFHRALEATSCGGECMCGGGHVEVEGRAIDLYKLPLDVLEGREPTKAETDAAFVVN